MERAALHYPFADAISPLAAELEALSRKWLFTNYPGLPPNIKALYAATNTGYLTARFFPMASWERLVPLAMSSLWGLAFDDYYEHATPGQFAQLKDRVGGIIRGSAAFGEENEFFRQMVTMADEFRKFMPYFWMERFARSMEIYIEGMAEEAPYKSSLTFPSLEKYMAIRWKSVDVLQMIDGLEVATEQPLPDNVRHHPEMERLAWLTCRIIAWCNDYFSASKERGRDVMNLVLVLEHEHSCGFEDALAEAVGIHDQDVEAYLGVVASLPDFGTYQGAVEKFISFNNLMIAGHWRWYLTDTYRYLSGGSPDLSWQNAIG